MTDHLSELSKRVFGPGASKPWQAAWPAARAGPQFAFHPFEPRDTVKPLTPPEQAGLKADPAGSAPEGNRAAHQPGAHQAPYSQSQTFLSEYHPSWREEAVSWLAGNSRGNTFRKDIAKALLGDPWPVRPLEDIGAIDFTPAAIPFALNDAYRAARRGDYLSAALDVGGAVPGFKIASSVRKMLKTRKAWAPSYAHKNGEDIFSPPRVEAAPFHADYPKKALADEAGRLTHTMDGDPLTARYIAGRREAGGPNVPLTDQDWLDIAGLLTRKPVQYEPKSVFRSRGAVGVFNPREGIKIWEKLQPPDKELVTAHEVAHAIDHFAGVPVKLSKRDRFPYNSSIPEAKNSKKELNTVFNDLNNSYLHDARLNDPGIDPKNVPWGTGVVPEKAPFDYKGKEADVERMAEAIRAYGSNPDYMKKVAPKTAKQIRKFVNTNKRLKDIIQFNSLLPAAGLSALYGAMDSYQDMRDEDFFK